MFFNVADIAQQHLAVTGIYFLSVVIFVIEICLKIFALGCFGTVINGHDWKIYDLSTHPKQLIKWGKFISQTIRDMMTRDSAIKDPKHGYVAMVI